MPTLTADEAALLAAVMAAPEDDAPRLIMADWYDEHGQAEYGEFIRVGCRMAELSASVRQGERDYTTYQICDFTAVNCDICREFAPLREREREFLRGPAFDWFKVKDLATYSSRVGGPFEGWCLKRSGEPGIDIPAVVSRGFVESVRCPMAAWLPAPCGECDGEGVTTTDTGGNFWQTECRACGGIVGKRRGSGRVAGAAAVARVQPVERVVFTDAVIHPSGGNDTYYVGNLGIWPREFWSQLENLPSRSAALSALSAVAIRLARR